MEPLPGVGAAQVRAAGDNRGGFDCASTACCSKSAGDGNSAMGQEARDVDQPDPLYPGNPLSDRFLLFPGEMGYGEYLPVLAGNLIR